MCNPPAREDFRWGLFVCAVLLGNEIPQKCPNSGEAVVNRRKGTAPMSRALIGRQRCARELSSGERMLAGGAGTKNSPTRRIRIGLMMKVQHKTWPFPW